MQERKKQHKKAIDEQRKVRRNESKIKKKEKLKQLLENSREKSANYIQGRDDIPIPTTLELSNYALENVIANVEKINQYEQGK